MKKIAIRSALIALGAVIISACSHPIPEFYKPDLRQGIILSQSQVEAVRPGMTKSQVIQLLGTPPIADPLHTNRWDYVYLYFPDQDRSRGQERYMTIMFLENVVTEVRRDRWQGSSKTEL